MDKISVLGKSSYIAGEFLKLYIDETVGINHRETKESPTNNIINFVSTTDNYWPTRGDLYQDIQINLLYLMDFLNAAQRKYNNDFVFNQVSSWFVVGKVDKLPVDEQVHCNPNGFYAISKYASELFLRSFCETNNIRYRILRLSNIYGKYDKGASLKKNTLHALVNMIKCNEDINLYDGGNVIRDYLYVTDCARAIKLVLDKGEFNTTYNIGSGKPRRFSDLILMARNMFHSSSRFINIDTPSFHSTIQTKDFYFNIDKLKQLGFEETTLIKDGIKSIL